MQKIEPVAAYIDTEFLGLIPVRATAMRWVRVWLGFEHTRLQIYVEKPKQKSDELECIATLMAQTAPVPLWCDQWYDADTIVPKSAVYFTKVGLCRIRAYEWKVPNMDEVYVELLNGRTVLANHAPQAST